MPDASIHDRNDPDTVVPEPAQLEKIAIGVGVAAADLVRRRYGTAISIGTKSSATDVVTQTDLDAETLIRSLLAEATPGCGFVGEEGGASQAHHRLQWVIDPLDGTVNFLYAVPIFAISIAACVDGEFVAGVVVDVMRNEVFSAHFGGGARRDSQAIVASNCAVLSDALVTTGFSYAARLRAVQGVILQTLLPATRDIRCFGSAALQACWVACGRVDVYFERDTKIWDWAAGALIAQEAGAVVDLPCPENDGLVLIAPPILIDPMRGLTAID